ncbi:hypothetical protein [Microcoleus sp.]
MTLPPISMPLGIIPPTPIPYRTSSTASAIVPAQLSDTYHH